MIKPANRTSHLVHSLSCGAMPCRCCDHFEMVDRVQGYREEDGGALPGHLVEYPVDVSQSGEVTTMWTLWHCFLVDSLCQLSLLLGGLFMTTTTLL